MPRCQGRARHDRRCIEHFAKGKHPTVGYLGQNELFLTNSVIPDKEKQAVAELDEITKAWAWWRRSKVSREDGARARARGCREEEEEHQRAINQSLLKHHLTLGHNQ